MYNVRTETPTQEFIGLVLDYDELNKIATIEQRNYFQSGERVEVFSPGFQKNYFKVGNIYDENNNNIDIARHPRQIVKLKIPFPVHPYDILRRSS